MTEKLNPNLIPENTKAFILDWDDTVMGTITAKIEQHKYVAREHFGISLTTEEMLIDWGRPLHYLIQKWYKLDSDDEAGYQVTLATILSYSTQFPKQPLEGALNAVGAIRECGYPIGVVTGSPRDDVKHDFNAPDVALNLFDYFQTSDDSEYHKPDPRVFVPALRWLSEIDIKPEDALYVGDTLNDYWATRGVEFMFMGVETGFTDMPTFYNAGALSIRSLGDLLKNRP